MKKGWQCVLLATFVYLLIFGGTLFHPFEPMPFHKGGDGLKNMYAPVYHIDHGKSAFHFDGMLYPYGEHLIFTDGQPLITSSMYYLAKIGLVEGSDFIIVQQYAYFLFYLIGCYFLCLLFLKLNLPDWLSILLSIGIILASPQWFRMHGHHALTYVGIPVLMIWWAYRQTENPKLWRWFLIALMVFLFMGLHPYYGIIGLVFYLSFTLLFFTQQRAHRLQWLLGGFSAGLLPILLFRIFTAITDDASLRSPDPWGFFYYRSYWPTLFLPPKQEWLEKYVQWHWAWDFEGWVYVGIPATLVLHVLLIRLLWRRRLDHPVMWRWYGVIIIGLLISAGIPFVLGLDFLLDFFPFSFVKQFRSPGRIAWIAYYLAGLFSVIVVFRWAVNYRVWGLIMPILIGCVSLQAYWTLKKTFEAITPIDTHRDFLFKPDTLQTLGVSKKEYNAIFSIPMGASVGSEHLKIAESDYFCTQVYVLAYKLGLPAINYSSARTSLLDAWEVNRFYYPHTAEKPELFKYLRKNSLIVFYHDHPATAWQKQLLAHATKIHQEGQFTYLSLSSSQLRAAWNAYTTADTLFQTESYCLGDCGESAQQTLGKTGFMAPKYLSLPAFKLSTEIKQPVLRFWYFAKGYPLQETKANIRIHRPGNAPKASTMELQGHVSTFDDTYVLVELPLSDALRQGDRVQLSLENPRSKLPLQVNRVTLSEIDEPTGRKLKSGVWINNLFYPS
ncbi:MAG: hypothetical protein ACK52I_30620 [Pseudomonadota bacterium]